MAVDQEERAREVQLLREVAGGDHTDAIVALHRIYSGQLYRFGLRLLGDAGQAEDLVQDTFVGLWQSAGRFDERRGSVRTFLFTIAQRTGIDVLRRRSARPHLVTAGDQERMMERSTDADHAERLADEFLVREALDYLSPDHRQILELSFDEDLSDQQISDRLSVPVGTVRSRTYYALRAMRLQLEERGLVA